MLGCLLHLPRGNPYLFTEHSHRANGAAVTLEFIRYMERHFDCTVVQCFQLEKLMSTLKLLTTRMYSACSNSSKKNTEKKKVAFLTSQTSSASTAERIHRAIVRNVSVKKAVTIFLQRCRAEVQQYSFLKRHCEGINKLLGYVPPAWAKRVQDLDDTKAYRKPTLKELACYMDLVFAILQTDTKVCFQMCLIKLISLLIYLG